MFFNFGMNSWMITSGGLTRLENEADFGGNDMEGSLMVESIGGVDGGTEMAD